MFEIAPKFHHSTYIIRVNENKSREAWKETLHDKGGKPIALLISQQNMEFPPGWRAGPVNIINSIKQKVGQYT